MSKIKCALFFCLNREYLEQFKMLSKSLHKNGGIISDVDWFVFSPDVEAVDGATVVKTNCEYKTDLDGEPYQNSDDKIAGMRWLANAGYDQAVYLDCDIVITGNISRLFNKINCDMMASREYHYQNNYPEHPVYIDTKRISEHYFNSGVMVIDLKSDCIWKEPQGFDRSGDLAPDRAWRDQEKINFMFRDCNFKWLKKCYNWKPELYAPLFGNDLADHIKDRNSARVIHFAGKAKPYKAYPVTAFSFDIAQAPVGFYRKITDGLL